MRSVILAILLLLGVSATIAISGVYTHNVAQAMLDDAEMICSVTHKENERSVTKMIERWERAENILICLYDHRHVQAIDVALTDLKASVVNGNCDSVAIYKSELMHHLTYLKEISGISLKKIL